MRALLPVDRVKCKPMVNANLCFKRKYVLVPDLGFIV